MVYNISEEKQAKAAYKKCSFRMPTKEENNMTVTKDTKIFDILQENRETAPFFLEMGMHCLGCPSARNETLGQACAVHGVNADELAEKINNFLKQQA